MISDCCLQLKLCFSVSGLGFGIISGAFSLVNVLADMAGPGTIGIHGDSKYFFLASGKFSQSLILCTLMDSSFWFYTINLGQTIIHI